MKPASTSTAEAPFDAKAEEGGAPPCGSSRGRRPARTAGTQRHLLLAIAPDERIASAKHLLSKAHDLARGLGVRWTVLCIETPGAWQPSRSARDSRIDIFRAAASLGAETATLEAVSAADALREFVDAHGTGTLVLGAPRARRIARRSGRSLPATLLASGIEADLILIARREKEAAEIPEARLPGRWFRSRKQLIPYVHAMTLTALCSAITLPMLNHFDLVDMAMVFTLGATFAALRLGRGPAIFTSLANIAAFDYFLIPPRLSFLVTETQYCVTFAVMLVVSLIIANLAAAVRGQTVAAAARERRTAALYAMSRELAITRDSATMARVAEKHIAEASHGTVTVLLCDERGSLPRLDTGVRHAADPAICRWVVANGKRAGLGSADFADQYSMYLPLAGHRRPGGVLLVTPSDPRRALLPRQHQLLQALAMQLEQALERVRLVDAAQTAHLKAERVALRNTLLASISHDLRTPLSTIAGAGSMLAQDDFTLDLHRRMTLGKLIEDKARDMNELLSNVLQLVRLETNGTALKREWHSLQDLLGQALRQRAGRLTGWQVRLIVPGDFPTLFVEYTLILQMLGNLLENCRKHTPAGTEVEISAGVTGADARIWFRDNGPGFPSGDPDRLFDKFERGAQESAIAGVGLGLAICRAVARLHGGEIWAARVATGGACFQISLPLDPHPRDDTP